MQILLTTHVSFIYDSLYLFMYPRLLVLYWYQLRSYSGIQPGLIRLTQSL